MQAPETEEVFKYHNPSPLTKKTRFVSILADGIMSQLYITVMGVVLLIVMTIYQAVRSQPVSESFVHIYIWGLGWLLLVGGTTLLDYRFKGSLGKQLIGIEVNFKDHTVINCLVRNAIKWIPLGLLISALTHAYFVGFDGLFIILLCVSLLLLVGLIAMCLIRSDQRHLIDLLLRSQVLPKSINE